LFRAFASNELSNLSQRKAELLSLKDGDQAIGVLLPLKASTIVVALGAEKTSALIEPQRPKTDLKLPGQVPDGKDRLAHHARSPKRSLNLRRCGRACKRCSFPNVRSTCARCAGRIVGFP